MEYFSEADDEQLILPNANQSSKGINQQRQKLSIMKWFPVRYIIAVVCAIATLAMSLMRACMGMAIVCMTNHTAILVQQDITEALSYCPSNAEDNSNDTTRRFNEDGPFIWSDNLQAMILGSFYWGYIVTQFPAGIAVEKFSGKWTMAIALLISSALCLAIPVTAMHAHVSMVIVVIVGIGLAQGFTYPVVYGIVSRWAPKNERSRMLTIAVSGLAIAQMMVNYISASLCSSDFDKGWTYIFYLFGGCGMIGLIIWIGVIEDHPSTHRWVSSLEANHIKSTSECRQQPITNVKIPWSAILRSKPFWVLILVETIFAFKGNTLAVYLPTYMKVIMSYDIKQNGAINSVPYIVKGIIGITAAFASDIIISRGYLTVTNFRKLIVSAIVIVTCVCLVGVTLAGCNKTTVIILFGIAIVFDSLVLVGIFMNVIDLAPNFVGILKGMVNTASAFGNLAAPSIIGLIISKSNSVSSWNNVFYLISGLNLIVCLAYIVYGSGNAQYWNQIESSTDDDASESCNADSTVLLNHDQSTHQSKIN